MDNIVVFRVLYPELSNKSEKGRSV